MFEILRGQGRTVWTVSFLSSYPLSSVFCPSRPSVRRGARVSCLVLFPFLPRLISPTHSLSFPLFPSSRVASCLSAPRGGEIWLLLLREGRTRSFFAFWDHHHHLFAAGPPSRVLPAAGSYREERKESGERERERERESARGVEES